MIEIRGRNTSRLAPWILAVSAIGSVAISTPTAPDDLHAYVYGGAALNHLSDLYGIGYVNPISGVAIPFVYPPFAAMLFYPMHLMPFWLVALLWRVAVIAALYASVRVSQKMLGDDDRAKGMLWAALFTWGEPVVGNIKSGNVGVFLMLAVLYAAYNRRWWLSGLLVGAAAGVKLVPAIAGLYFVGVRRWGTVAFSAVVFFATLAVAYPVAGDRVRYYFTDWIRTDSSFSAGYTVNQSWRAGIARVLGYDPGMSYLVLAVIAASAVFAGAAYWFLRGDQLGSLLMIMIFALLASPVAWTNHWVWLVPLMMWLWQSRGARPLFWAWFAVTMFAIPNALANLQADIQDISRPWYLAWAALVYPLLTLVTFAWIVVTGLRMRRNAGEGEQRRVVREGLSNAHPR